jgi:aminodeoxyfutalosine deaminase
VVISGNQIEAVGPFREIAAQYGGEVTDLGEQVLMPGLVNAHCHLDYTMMRHAIQPQRTFADWIRRINALKRSLADEDYIKAIQHGLDEARKWGTTAMANIEAFPELILHLPTPPIRVWWFLEMIDIRHRETSEETVAGALAFFHEREDWLGGFGLSPHAPYTASSSLFELAGQAAEKLGMPITTHVAESREEMEMFQHARGELYDFMLKLGRWMYDCHQQRTPLGHVLHSARVNRTWILAHMNELEPADLARLAAMPADRRPSVVHCPGSHRYFRHRPFPLAQLKEAGVNVCLGTDSLASTESLSMFDEMRIFSRRSAWVPPEEVVRMALNGAQALNIPAGELRPGAWADMIAFPYEGNVAGVYPHVIAHREPIAWLMVNGHSPAAQPTH